MDLDSTIMTRDGVAIPRLGLGVFRAGSGQGTRDAVRWALERGYRHVDTARVYGNEEDVGVGLRESGVPREQVFVTTKLWNGDQGFDSTLAAFDASLAALGLEVIDLYLMHWPVPELRLGSWRAMERILEEKRARAIGVSNFMPRHLEELSAHANVMPAVNQIEIHPFGQQRETIAWCAAHDIVIEAYSPLTKGQRLDDPTLAEIAREVSRTPAQVLIRWSLEKGYVVIPKSARRERIDENANVFDFTLGEENVRRLDALEQGLHFAWDPSASP